jgi:energy-coupling factor transporter ATP-binding protein EcfA2
LRWYPPLWFSIGLAFGIAAFFDAVLPPSRNSLTPAWQRLDVLGPLGIIAMVASAWRQLPWRRATPAQQAAVEAVVPLTWDDLKRWFRREEPLQNGPDLFGHAPIAERIYNAIIQPENQAIALIGLVGSGKSSILNAVKHKLHHQSTSFTIVAEFNCWAMPRPEDAPRLALERAIDALSDVIDAQAVRRLPLSYQRILSAEPTGKLSRLVGVDDVPDAVDQLRTLTSLLEVIDARLLLIIEDAERAGQSFETRHLERLLWTLRHVDRVSFILSFDVQRASFDYPKLCDIIERVRPITVDRVEEVLAPAYSAWRTASDTYIDPISSEKRQDRLGLENVTDSTMRYLRRTHGDSAADAIAALLTSPRNLKHFIRDVDRAWDQLRGEVELNDLIVLTALRHGAPAAFDFIVDNVEAARSERKERDAFAGDAVKTIKPRWEKLRNSLAQPTMVQNLVDVLDLNQLNSDSTVSSQSSPQGIHNGEPVDYLGRILAGQLLPGEIRDQDVLRDIEMWKNARSGAMLEKLATATPESDEYVAVWRHYAHRFSFEQVIDIAGALANALLITLGANASMQHPAMGAVWRQSSRYMERDTKTAWLIEQIQTVLPTSLGFATDLFQYFGSVADGIVTGAHRAQVRAALVESARASLNTADSLLASLGSQHEVPLTRLVYPPPSDQPPDTISFSSWGWLVDLIIEAARTNEERVVPDVAVLVGDTMQGFRTGTFERRYILKRDWMTEIFGPRTDDMLHILADYHGGQEHALGARKEAKMWLAERARPSDKT